jgi:hypothetical protein
MLKTTRRLFFGIAAGVARAAQSATRAVKGIRVRPAGAVVEEDRRQAALQLRIDLAMKQSQVPLSEHIANGDEQRYQNYIGNFTKGMPHSQLGEVLPGAYETLLNAISTGDNADFERISWGSGRRFVSPQAAFAYELDGADPHRFGMLPPPALESAEMAAEMVELYWQALLRDVPFGEYSSSQLVAEACAEMSSLSGFTGPRQDGAVTPEIFLRGAMPGIIGGPFVSQFLLQPIPCNSGWMEQRYRVPVAGVDFMESYTEWLQLQTGVPPWRPFSFEPSPKYICTGRGLAEYVHFDYLYQAFLNAALILMDKRPETLLNYNYFLSEANPYKHSRVQDGFVTFGCPHILDLLTRSMIAAMKAAWFQKWSVHRRLRPEAVGGRVHHALSGTATYSLHQELTHSAAVKKMSEKTGTYLLSQSYAEGSPLHPAYPSGHATVSGACATMLKAFFDETNPVPNAVIPSSGGDSLVSYTEVPLTVGGEINKLAFNIGMGRNFAGIHYRWDLEEGMKLGEQVSLALLEDLVMTLNESFPGFEFTCFDGRRVRIGKGGVVWPN